MEDKSSSTQSLPAKPVVRQISNDSGLETSDKSTTSTSQPNIIIRETDIIGVDPPDPTPPSTPHSSIGTPHELTSSMSSGSDLSPIQEDHELKRTTSSPPSSIMDSSSMSMSTISDSGADELSLDIDNALEEVMAGLKSLEMQQKSDKRMSLPVVKLKQTPKHTPDLVLDLPEGSNTPPSQDSSEPDSPTTAAETFAKSNQGTLKKAGGPILVPPAVPAVAIPGSVSSTGPSSGFQRSVSPTNRHSISSEPGDLAREAVAHSLMTTFAASPFRRSQQASMPSVHHMPSRHGFGCKTSSISSFGSGGSSSAIGSAVGSSSSLVGGIGTGVGSGPGVGGSGGDAGVITPISTPKTTPVQTPTPPPVAQKPKPPVKVKPPVMKKPTKPDSSPASVPTPTSSPQTLDSTPK